MESWTTPRSLGGSTVSAAPPHHGDAVEEGEGPWRDALRRRLLATTDMASVLIAFLLLGGTFGTDAAKLIWVVPLLPVWLLLAKLLGLYDRDHRVLRHQTADELPSLITWTTVGLALMAGLLSLTPDGAPSAPSAVRLWVSLLIVAPVMRTITRALWRAVMPPERALIVGSGRLEEATRRKLELFGDIHVRTVGEIRDEALAEGGLTGDRIAELVEKAAGRDEIDRIILASQVQEEELIAGLVAYCRGRGVKLSVVPPVRAMFGTAVQLNHVADLPLIEYSTWDVPRSTMLLKRCIDIGVSAVALLVLSPLLVLIGLAVRLDSRGKSLFSQWRAGIEGRRFRMYKFRTMVADAEERLAEVVRIEDLDEPVFKLTEDPRVTRVGRFLRRASLDELPQLINVLKGDMSLVGPRPEQVELVERYAPEHLFRLSVKPGLTGPMQVYGRGELRFDERLAVEREYVENLSLKRDFRILLLTASAVFGRKGAY
jgi:exopolysaccharide biosynthesis polyprenyl glycosylphosphotransferase